MSEPHTVAQRSPADQPLAAGDSASLAADHPPWLVELPSCPSTNSWARERLDQLAHGHCVWTRRQSAGRGQDGRRWCSPPGVLTASFVLQLPGDARNRQLSLAAGLAVAHSVEDLAADGTHVAIKWPNDCYCGDRKLGGILCEGRSRGDRLQVVVGIGLNVDPDWTRLDPAQRAELDPPPTSLRELGIAVPTPVALLDRLRDYLLAACALLNDGRWGLLAEQLRSRDWLLGRRVEVEQGGASWLGQAAGIDDDGALVVGLPDGGSRRVEGGRVRGR